MSDLYHTYVHFIDECNNEILFKQLIFNVPRVGDQIRLGGKGNEKYYVVNRVFWVYDEPDSPYYRVNIGVSADE